MEANSIIGRELRTVRSSLYAFNIIIAEVEKLTGLLVAKMDILRQSETGKEGKKEALFSYHIDTDEVKTAIAMATILLTDTESSMKILGYRPVPYHGVGSGCLFASDLFHQTVTASEGTMKVTLFLERCQYDRWNICTTQKGLKILTQNGISLRNIYNIYRR